MVLMSYAYNGTFIRFVAAVLFSFVECKYINFVFFILNFAAVFFLEYWKRKEITLAYQWDVLGFEEEEVRHIRTHEISFHNETGVN